MGTNASPGLFSRCACAGPRWHGQGCPALPGTGRPLSHVKFDDQLLGRKREGREPFLYQQMPSARIIKAPILRILG